MGFAGWLLTTAAVPFHPDPVSVVGVGWGTPSGTLLPFVGGQPCRATVLMAERGGSIPSLDLEEHHQDPCRGPDLGPSEVILARFSGSAGGHCRHPPRDVATARGC